MIYNIRKVVQVRSSCENQCWTASSVTRKRSKKIGSWPKENRRIAIFSSFHFSSSFSWETWKASTEWKVCSSRWWCWVSWTWSWCRPRLTRDRHPLCSGKSSSSVDKISVIQVNERNNDLWSFFWGGCSGSSDFQLQFIWNIDEELW